MKKNTKTETSPGPQHLANWNRAQDMVPDYIKILWFKQLAHQRANLIFRSFVSRDVSRDVSLLLRAYLTYVRPLVECNSVVWSPCLKQDIETVERVQRRFTKRLPGFKNLTYTERLKRLKLPSLELRRLYNDLTWCYKILFGYVDVSSDEFFAPSPAVPQQTNVFQSTCHQRMELPAVRHCVF